MDHFFWVSYTGDLANGMGQATYVSKVSEFHLCSGCWIPLGAISPGAKRVRHSTRLCVEYLTGIGFNMKQYAGDSQENVGISMNCFWKRWLVPGVLIWIVCQTENGILCCVSRYLADKIKLIPALPILYPLCACANLRMPSERISPSVGINP